LRCYGQFEALFKPVSVLSFSFFSLERKESNKEKFKANPALAGLRRFALPRLPKFNSLFFW
jgi:hypothetical protein